MFSLEKIELKYHPSSIWGYCWERVNCSQFSLWSHNWLKLKQGTLRLETNIFWLPRIAKWWEKNSAKIQRTKTLMEQVRQKLVRNYLSSWSRLIQKSGLQRISDLLQDLFIILTIPLWKKSQLQNQHRE